jgi:hypothetical protein
MPDYRGYTVAEILKQFKQAGIKKVPLPPGSPSWAAIMNLPWEEIVRRAKKGTVGFRVFKKLLLQPEV